MITGLCDSFLNILNMYSFLIETQQPYNIVLFSTIEQHESTIGIHMSIPSWTSEPENIQKTKIMSSGPITLGQTDGETMETVTDFIWGGGATKSLQMVIAAIKRRLLPGRKAMTN